MATALHERFRREVRALGIEAERDVAFLWRSTKDARDAKAALFDLLPGLVTAYHGAAATAAADFYDEARDVAEARGRFTPILGGSSDLGTTVLVKWALSAATDGNSFQSLVAGGVNRRVVNGAREVVTRSSIADPAAKGWMRVGSGGCDFCAMLIGRGAVYTEATADFEAHDHCSCAAVPAF